MAEESGTTVKLSYDLEVKAEVSPGAIKLDYHLKIKVEVLVRSLLAKGDV